MTGPSPAASAFPAGGGRRLGVTLGAGVAVALACALAACGDGAGDAKPAVPAAAPRYVQDGSLPDGTKATWRPNVLLMCVSGLRHADAFPSSWSEPPPAELTSFSSGATVFENAAATAGWEGPSFVSLLTGMYAKSHGIVSRRGEEMGTLIPSHVMPAEILKAQGWRTAAFTEGGALGRGRGLEQGFDEYVDDWRVERGEVIEAWLAKAAGGKPFFLVVHVPLHGVKKPAEVAANLLARFTAKARGPLVTIFTSDCGRPLDGIADPAAVPRGDSLGEEWIHVPLAISAPGRFKPGRAVGSCSVADVAPTILDLVGLPKPAEMDGRSLAPLAADLKNPGAPVRAHASLKGSDVFAVRSADAKFLAKRDVIAQKWTEEAFDLHKDPKETAPLAGDRVADLGAAFAKAVDDLRERLRAKIKSSDEIRDKGYFAGGGY